MRPKTKKKRKNISSYLNYTKGKILPPSRKKLLKKSSKKVSKKISKKSSKKVSKKISGKKSNKLFKIKSYSPSINKKLVSLKNTVAFDLFGCKSRSLEESLLTVNIGTLNKPKCIPYNNKLAVKNLLKNLKASVNLDCSKVVPPKQLNSNCWFNTMFMVFFVSDKGRKFFRFFRQLMIEGKQINGKAIPRNLAMAFFMFNMAIEASYNLTEHTKTIAYNFDSNLLIKNIYNSINNSTIHPNRNIRNVGESGNPLDYYLSIMHYLDNSSIKLKIIEFSNDVIERNIIQKYGKQSASNTVINEILLNILMSDKLPHILVLEYSDNNSNNIADKEKQLIINTKSGKIQYKLDSIIIRDTSQQHFCALLTCNGIEMSFDGASYSRMTPFKWKDKINQNKDWTFKADYDLKWNFRNGYHMAFYYRI